MRAIVGCATGYTDVQHTTARVALEHGRKATGQIRGNAGLYVAFWAHALTSIMVFWVESDDGPAGLFVSVSVGFHGKNLYNQNVKFSIAACSTWNMLRCCFL